MPFSILIQAYPQADVPAMHVQGPALRGMFLHLIRDVDEATCQRLHDDSAYRPYTISPLGIGEPGAHFDGFRLLRSDRLHAGTPCYLRLTLLEDHLFPIFSRYFLDRPEPTFYLGETTFGITNVVGMATEQPSWAAYAPYQQLIDQASHQERYIVLRFLTPTSFSFGEVDLPLPLPKLVFQSFRRRFEEFAQVTFLPDFEAQVERYTEISRLQNINTERIVVKKASFLGCTGRVTYHLNNHASPDLIFQMNLLADFALFCGTGKQTAVGMGQTVRMNN